MKKLLLLSLLCSFSFSYMADAAEAAAASAQSSGDELFNGYYSSEEREFPPIQTLIQAHDDDQYALFEKTFCDLLKGSNQEVTLENPDGTHITMTMSSLTVLMIKKIFDKLDEKLPKDKEMRLKRNLRRLLRMLSNAFEQYKENATLRSTVSGGYYHGYTTYDLALNCIVPLINGMLENSAEYNLYTGDAAKLSHIITESTEKGQLTLANRVRASVCSATSAVTSAFNEFIDRQREAQQWQREIQALDIRDIRNITVQFSEDKDSRSASPEFCLEDSGNGDTPNS